MVETTQQTTIIIAVATIPTTDSNII